MIYMSQPGASRGIHGKCFRFNQYTSEKEQQSNSLQADIFIRRE